MSRRSPGVQGTSLVLIVLLALAGVPTTPLAAKSKSAAPAETTWPRELDTEKGVFTIYQPQPEKFEQNVLVARAAISRLKKEKKAKPVFGVIWFTGRVDTD